jgi:hypothetical protein
MKIRQVGAELFHTDGQTDDGANSLFRNFANKPKKGKGIHILHVRGYSG